MTTKKKSPKKKKAPPEDEYLRLSIEDLHALHRANMAVNDARQKLAIYELENLTLQRQWEVYQLRRKKLVDSGNLLTEMQLAVKKRIERKFGKHGLDLRTWTYDDESGALMPPA